MHVSAPVAIWTFVYVYLRAGGDSKAIWTYVDLRVCMFPRPYGFTFLYIAAPAVIWTYVYAYASVAGCGGGANVAVARVSCMFVCKVGRRFEPTQHFKMAWRNGIANVIVA